MNQIEVARYFHKLHNREQPLILANAWDALSAKLFELAGAKAIATSSAAMAWVHGVPDGERLTVEQLLSAVERIIKVVRLPVSVDIESGYSDNLSALNEFIDVLLQLGVVGINIEDSHPANLVNLEPLENQIKKIQAVKTRAKQRAIPLFVNARTNIYWAKLYKTDEECLEESLKRLHAYEQAGADGLFLPGCIHPETIRKVAESLNKPLNILACPALKSIDEVKQLGIARVSLGSSPNRAMASWFKMKCDLVFKQNQLDCFISDWSNDAIDLLFTE